MQNEKQKKKRKENENENRCRKSRSKHNSSEVQLPSVNHLKVLFNRNQLLHGAAE